MRVYHTLVFDENIEGTAALYSDPMYNDQLAVTEKLEIFAVADTVAGTSPTLTAQIEESPDGIHWQNKNGTAEINAVSLSTTLNTIAVGRDAGTNLGSGLCRLRVVIGGTGNPKGHVRVWATGRGEQGG
jgi:hypothetical protein